ncbi:hypothetical protein HYU11_03180 [Candidatus Woesearchaeota archaeon]|nr:hypothetical protein [Candidatus Woesearchaeota archaeon]
MAGPIEEYERLRKLHRLPDFATVEREFDISNCEESRNILKSVREFMGDKISKVCEILEDILQPDTNLSSLYESRVFTEIEKKSIFDVYRKFMILKRRSDSLFVINSEQADIEFIRSTYSEWENLKPKMMKIISSLEESWSRESEVSDRLAYFG